MADSPAPAKATEKPLKVGQRVDVVKDAQSKVRGTVAYVGTTLFSPGKWIGVILDEPKGKNNGTVMGKSYFTCKDSYGMFVRQNCCIPLDDGTEDSGPISQPSTPAPPSVVESPALGVDKAKSSSRQSLSKIPSSSAPSKVKKTSQTASKTTHQAKNAETKGPEAKSTEAKGPAPKKTSAGNLKLPMPAFKGPATPSTPQPPHLPASSGQPSIPETPTRGEESVPATPKAELSKRASFVETGFVETLKTQFTPGVPLSPSLSTAIEERVTGMQLAQENDNLKAEIRDLNEKLETLKVRRNQDKEKLKEADKLKLQVEQLLEFKKAILESHSQLQKEMQRVKQEAKDTLVEQQSKMHDNEEFQELLEMATLDKEMAEEKAESLQLELDQAKQKIEELTVDLELLKAEMGDKGGEGGASSLELKQLEQQNARLKETLVKMRDLAAHEKLQNQNAMREMEKKLSEVTDLKKTKQTLTSQVEEMQNMITELQDQVDAALGAEEMVEQLTDRNLALEEKISELQEAVADLEQLHEMNEELQETARETELELREELDISRGRIQELMKERDAVQEMVADRNMTIEKFREVVQKLQEANQQLRESLERETNKPMGAPLEVIDYQKMFTETKTFTKTIDLELRKLDVLQAREHVKYLCNYMPDSFMARGGDNFSVQQLLLMSRLLFKCDMLAAQVKEKFAGSGEDANAKSLGPEQRTFGSRLLHLIFSLQCSVRQFSNALNSCSPEQFLEMGTLYQEMSQQEKAVDFYVELLRKDQLDENVQLEALEKSANYFGCMYASQFKDTINGVWLLTDQARAVLSAADGLILLSNRVQSMMQAGHEGSDVAIAIKEVLTQATQWQQYARTVRRRLPTDGSSGPINLPPDVPAKLQQASGHVVRLLRTMQEWTRMVSQHLSASGEPDGGVPVAKMRELAHASADAVYTEDYSTDGGFFDCVHGSLSFVGGTFSSVSTALVDGQFDFDGTPNTDTPPAPVMVRAQTLKAEIRDLENLRHKLEERENIIKEINVILRNKQEELSEMNVRKEMAEKKLSNAARDHEVATEKLTRKLEDTQLLLKRKEKEFNETIEHLQSDMDTLEKEKAELKEKLMHSSKKTLLEGLTKSTPMGGASQFSSFGAAQLSQLTSAANAAAAAAAAPAQGAGAPSAVAKDSPYLIEQVATLRSALKYVTQDRARWIASDLKSKLESLPPLPAPKKEKADDAQYFQELESAIKEAEKLKFNILRTFSTAKVNDPSPPTTTKTKEPATLSEKLLMQRLAMRKDIAKLQSTVARLAASHGPGTGVATEIATFPIPELSKAISHPEPVKFATLSIPKPKSAEHQIRTKSVVLEPHEIVQVNKVVVNALLGEAY